MYVTKKIYKLSDIKYNNFKYNFNLFTKLFSKWNNDVVKIKKSIQKSKKLIFLADMFFHK